MSLVVLGINHHSAPLTVREKLSFQPAHVHQVLQDLMSHDVVNEAVVLSTCNRTEVYAAATDITPVKHYLMKEATLSGLNLDPYAYVHRDSAMVQHAIRVASGLDSMVMGEPQILGQMKQAYALACQAGTVGKHLSYLFPATFAASKRIRHQTAIGANPVSLAYAIVQLAKQLFSQQLADCRALLIGAGDIIELVTTHLYAQGIRHITIANRTIERAQRLAQSYQAHAIRLAEIPYHLAQTDIVITATAHQLPILGKGLLENVLAHRADRPLFMVDLAVPRNIEPEVGPLPNAHLYNIDHLQTILATHAHNRSLAAQQAETMAEMQAEHYMRQWQVLKAGDMIRRFRSRLETLRDTELSRAIAHLDRTQSPKDALAYLAHHLTNKVLHQPTIRLRQAAYEERMELLLSAKDLFDL